MNKVVAFVIDNDDGNPSVIEWTKGESAVTIIWKKPVEKPKKTEKIEIVIKYKGTR